MRVLVVLSVVILGAIFWGVVTQKQLVVKVEKKSPEEMLDRELLLPDMVALDPREIVVSGANESKRLRFSTTFANKGKGALELIGHGEGDKNYVAQYIKEKNGPGEYRQVGSFVLHPTHNHWHVEDYVKYELWSVENGIEKDLFAETDKMSFCIWDEDKLDPDLENASPRQVYTFDCGKKFQGMSVGWSDTYAAKVDGQEMNISNIADGQYVFKSMINPDKRIIESDYENNESKVMIEIVGNRVKRL